MAAALGAVDELIREYLLYKGFVQTLRAFDQDRREDKDKGLKVFYKVMRSHTSAHHLYFSLSMFHILYSGESYSGLYIDCS